ncbi:response regulator [Trinickia dinghuensis]|uniref:Response regulator n=1 Tax=Trinickia dinghuensis TaxID=2291023 RepID=A0A3D8K1Y4_9BURK|nr:response regulator [Trinickia dinghuensis]RDU99477.1 response regulator [Trinickia dinghuensis]
MFRILLVEDDHSLAIGMSAGLRMAGLTVERVSSAARSHIAMSEKHFDLVLLDLGLPDQDGLEVLKDWRAQEIATPILVVTARDAIEHRIEGLTSGADDYLIKPFDLGELIARVHALIRRATAVSKNMLQHGRLRFSLSDSAAWLDEEPVVLSRRETVLLGVLLRQPQAVFSADQLRAYLYGSDDGVESNALSVHIHHLRRKFGAQIVETVRGIGYRLGKAE